MQNLDEFRVRNFTKKVLNQYISDQNTQIYTYMKSDEKEPDIDEKQNDGDPFSQFGEPINGEEEKQRPGRLADLKPVVAPMPGDHVDFEKKVEGVLQSFVDAEHASNLMMPSINCPIPVLTEQGFRQYQKQNEMYKRLYEHVEQKQEMSPHSSDVMSSTDLSAASTILEEKKSPELPKLPTSLMLIQGSYDSRQEKLELLQKDTRKVYSEYESCYELQDQYCLNDD